MRHLYIVLPAYNEEKSISNLFYHIKEAMEEFSITNYTTVVVDDGSKDNTYNVVSAHRKDMNIELLKHEVNQGLGATIRDGLFHAAKLAADRDIIITMDADDTHTPGLIMGMRRMIIEGYDVVIASRYQRGSRIFGVSGFRKLLSHGASWIFRIMYPIKGVKDFTCGFRAYRAGVIKKAIEKYGANFINQEGFQCMVDILLKLRKMKVIFGEAPFILRYDQKQGQSKMKIFKTIKNTLVLIFKRKISMSS